MNNNKKKMDTNRDLVLHLYNNCIIRSNRVIDVMDHVDRKDFTNTNVLYDRPERLILNQTISAPNIHGRALEVVLQHCVPGNRVLDVGCGSGYLTACFMRLLEVDKNPKSKVVGIDLYDKLVKLSKKNLLKNHKMYLPKELGGSNPNNNVKLLCGNGWKGYKHKGFSKYDVIHVGASSNKIPQELVDQLNINGIMIIPIGNKYKVINKNRYGEVSVLDILNVRFVPLTNEQDNHMCIS